MAQPLSVVRKFFDNKDAYAGFLARVEAAIVDKARDLRAEAAPSPVTAKWVARQEWADDVLGGPFRVEVRATEMLPALASLANELGFLNSEGEISVTDEQITLANRVAYFCACSGYSCLYCL